MGAYKFLDAYPSNNDDWWDSKGTWELVDFSRPQWKPLCPLEGVDKEVMNTWYDCLFVLVLTC
jgi:hypothetical protein